MFTSMIAEFKAFAFKGSLIDIAVGFVLGVAFGTVVQSVVDDLISPIIGAIFGQPDFRALTFGLGDGVVRYGSFLTVLANFLLVAFALFLVVKAVNRATRPRGAATEPPATRECPYCLTAIPVAASRCSACTSQVDPQPA